jgi:hypothetical protein
VALNHITFFLKRFIFPIYQNFQEKFLFYLDRKINVANIANFKILNILRAASDKNQVCDTQNRHT